MNSNIGTYVIILLLPFLWGLATWPQGIPASCAMLLFGCQVRSASRWRWLVTVWFCNHMVGKSLCLKPRWVSCHEALLCCSRLKGQCAACTALSIHFYGSSDHSWAHSQRFLFFHSITGPYKRLFSHVLLVFCAVDQEMSANQSLFCWYLHHTGIAELFLLLTVCYWQIMIPNDSPHCLYIYMFLNPIWDICLFSSRGHLNI